MLSAFFIVGLHVGLHKVYPTHHGHKKRVNHGPIRLIANSRINSISSSVSVEQSISGRMNAVDNSGNLAGFNNVARTASIKRIFSGLVKSTQTGLYFTCKHSSLSVASSPSVNRDKSVGTSCDCWLSSGKSIRLIRSVRMASNNLRCNALSSWIIVRCRMYQKVHSLCLLTTRKLWYLFYQEVVNILRIRYSGLISASPSFPLCRFTSLPRTSRVFAS